MEPHLTEEELLSLVDRSFDADEEIRLYRHLLQCDGCLEDLRFMAHDRVFPIPGRMSKRERRSLVDSGMFVAQEARQSINAIQPDAPTHSDKKPRRRVFGFAAIAAGLIVVVAAASIWRSQVPGPDLAATADSISTSITEPILIAMTEVSTGISTVMPGTEDNIVTTDDGFRSNGVGYYEEVDASMDVLSARYADGEQSRDLLYWLIGGYILDGQFDLVGEMADDLDKYPDDAELKTLCGLAAYENGDLQAAKDWLQSAVAKEGNTGVAALNLGIVLRENGEHDEARAILRKVHESQPEKPLGKRAIWLLDNYPESD